jgi:hypothetical protein
MVLSAFLVVEDRSDFVTPSVHAFDHITIGVISSFLTHQSDCIALLPSGPTFHSPKDDGRSRGSAALPSGDDE